ncbi:hypothetical protein D1B33_04825 [Lysinibacillus yapensis]|uniref:Lipoprotein n=1 Tax=Ureibacillus yapensis TaxID=2304605 RepID=A0A396SHM4_9BACL|nr:hypothetical protein [Lysinibacillus yapensis]RHW38215.1 hypothetical protein D1B33_04825 [Lysinibacillus yapensis]
MKKWMMFIVMIVMTLAACSNDADSSTSATETTEPVVAEPSEEEKYQEFLTELRLKYVNEQYPEVLHQVIVQCADYVKAGDINKCVEDGYLKDDSIELYNKAFESYFNKRTFDLKILDDSILKSTYEEVQEDLLSPQNKEIFNGEVLTAEIDYVTNKSRNPNGSNSTNNNADVDKAAVYAFMKATYKRVTRNGEFYNPETHDPLVAYYASIKYDIPEAEASQIYNQGELGGF